MRGGGWRCTGANHPNDCLTNVVEEGKVFEPDRCLPLWSSDHCIFNTFTVRRKESQCSPIGRPVFSIVSLQTFSVGLIQCVCA